ncbi:hypothetical protein PGT21_014819 [Puccinia graminis f. sp. tritici]|uniref:Uncharacterized protein n=1 Tax=Puccinia graminis f. sp. tritici TaxID=56615 RepID=A0A5B0P0K0_PUCGR|nr:hypothetical protein PGT21_014819 [Puccinia graminis f. sp. tritici]
MANSLPHSRNKTQRDSSTGNRKGLSAAGNRGLPPGPNNQSRSSVQHIGNSGSGRKANKPPPSQACRALDTGSNNSLSGSMHAPKGHTQLGGQRKPSINKNGGGKSTLNPNAGVFQPGALSAIVSRVSYPRFLS